MQPLRVMIIREDHLTAVHGFNVSLQLNAASTATEGKCRRAPVTSIKIIKTEEGCRDDTIPKTSYTRRPC